MASFHPFLLSEPPALDLVNTRLYLNNAWIDLLDDSEGSSQWLLGEAPRLGLTATDVNRTSELAETLKFVRRCAAAAIEPTRHGKQPAATALTGLNETLRAAPETHEAHWRGNSVVSTRRRTGTRVDRVAAEFAAATIELLADWASIRKVRQCAAPACVMLFLARNARRRWCVPSVCGNRERVARYYRLHKDDRPVGSTTQPGDPRNNAEETPARGFA